MAPNILLFVTDDHAQWACGAYGNQEIRTPNLDNLARTGVVMENAFTPTPVCSPARASLLTGRLPSQHGIHDYIGMAFDRGPWLLGQPTLPQLLHEAGYRTGLAGKWHAGNEDTPAPGFDFWFSVGSDYPLEHGGQRRFCDQGRMVTLQGDTNQIIADQAADFLNAQDGRPFFLLASLTATHSPWSGHPERLVNVYRGSNFPDIPQDRPYGFGEPTLESLSVVPGGEREAQAQYYGAVSHVDEIVGRLQGMVADLGLRDETLVVYTADHGLNCGHHGLWGKGNATRPLNMLEESIRVPLILSRPGSLPAGERRGALVDHLDLFQTSVAWAGVQVPLQVGAYPGENMLPLFTNSAPAQGWRQVQFGEYGPLRMARTREYKLIRRHPSGPHELFHLANDPRECHNLFSHPAYQHLIDQLSELLAAHFERFSVSQYDGLSGSALPQHNLTEAWRI